MVTVALMAAGAVVSYLALRRMAAVPAPAPAVVVPAGELAAADSVR